MKFLRKYDLLILAALFIAAAFAIAYTGFAQKAIRVVPVAVGQLRDMEIPAINLSYEFNAVTGQFHFAKAVYVVQEGEIIGGKWVQRDQSVHEIPVADASLALQNAAATMKERVLRNYLKALNLSDKEATMEAAKVLPTTSTTTTTTTTTTVP